MKKYIDLFEGTVVKGENSCEYTILPWDGVKVAGRKLYPVSCKVCDADKELNPNTYYILKRDALKGKVPCHCGTSARVQEFQIPILVRRYLEGSCVEYVGQVGEFLGGKTKFKVYCKKHGKYKIQNSYARFISGQYGCNTCSSIPKNGQGTYSISRMSDDTSCIEKFSCSGAFLEGTIFKRNTEKLDHKGLLNYWDVTCPLCSEDKFVMAGLCNGIFTTHYERLVIGKTPCRCAISKAITREQAEFEIKESMEPIGYTFLSWENCNSNHTAMSVFNYTCNAEHPSKSTYKRFVTNGNRCKFCNNFGYNELRSEFKDYLYILKFTKDDEVFLKVGRTFNMPDRFSKFKKNYDIELLYSLEDKHELVFTLERELHFALETFHYTPLKKFSGSKTECFDISSLGHLVNCIEDFNTKSNCCPLFVRQE